MSALSDFMKKRNNISEILLVSDLDGTMMNRENDVSAQNREALKEFMSLGGRFAVCSGRVIGSSEWMKVPVNTPSILHNGGSIYDYNTREILWSLPMESPVRDVIADLFAHFPEMAWTVYTAREHYVLHHNAWSDWLSSIEGCSPAKINYNLSDITDPILKFVVPASSEEIDEARDYLDRKYQKEKEEGRLNFSYNVSLPTLFEFTGVRSDKSAALRELAKMCQVSMDDIIYMGDNMNDMTALKAAGCAVVPESGLETVRRIADYITVDQDEHIMVDVLRELKKGLNKNAAAKKK